MVVHQESSSVFPNETIDIVCVTVMRFTIDTTVCGRDMIILDAE
jgi:hypothetical protein